MLRRKKARAATGPIEIGTARPDELDAMLGVMCDSFGLPFEAARDIFYDDPYFTLENKRVLRVNGQVVSCLTLIDTSCWIGEGIARVGGIAGVATLPALRRRGYAGLLLADTVGALRQRGYALSALFPFSGDYYRKYGWETGGTACRYRTTPAQLPCYPEARSVRLAREEDIPALTRLYDAWSRGRALHCLRDAKRWRYLLSYTRQPLVYAAPGGPAEGYLLADHRPGAQAANALPGAFAAPTLRILEMHAATEAAQRGLVGYLAGLQTMGSIEMTVSWQDLEECGLLRLAVKNGFDEEPLATLEVAPAVMIRVVDMARAVEALLPNARGFAGAFLLTMHDAGQGDVQSVRVSGDGQICRIQADASSEPEMPSLEGDVRAWSPVFSGHLSLEDACALGRIWPSSPKALTLAAPLFPRRAPFLPNPDHF